MKDQQGREYPPWLFAKCEYCGRYGDLGQCLGCGAQTVLMQRIDVTTYMDSVPQYVEVKVKRPQA